MSHGSELPSESAPFLDGLYAAWRADPGSVPADWAAYFAHLELAPASAAARPSRLPPVGVGPEEARALKLTRLVEAYRSWGHRAARLDPLSDSAPVVPELDPRSVGLAEAELDVSTAVGGLFGLELATPREVIGRLEETYAGSIGVELSHLEDQALRRWLVERVESSRSRPSLTADERRRVLARLTDAEVFERFLQTKFLTEKRFSLEGAEALIVAIDRVLDESAERGVDDVVLGMAHRGRLNVLANVLGKPLTAIFREFLKLDEDGRLLVGSGDVKYHLGFSADLKTRGGRPLHLSLAFNPSHLEAIYPVLEGRVRARQDGRGDVERRRTLALVVHGDASFAGQGVVGECLNFSRIAGYDTGGTIHLIVDNQLGFTAEPAETRSSRYPSAIAASFDLPVFHVNGEDPEAVLQAAQMAVEVRHRFQRDVLVDLVCFRKYGHNEGDEPRFTQPLLYRKIDQHRTVRAVYASRLVTKGLITAADEQKLIDERKAKLEARLDETRRGTTRIESVPSAAWKPYHGGRDDRVPRVPTGLPRDELEPLARRIAAWPDGFEPLPKLVRGVLEERVAMAAGQKPFDWAFAEALAFASLVAAGHRVRLSGQDSARGTFTQRHAVLVDHRDGRRYVPLAHASPNQAPFEVFNSPLSEFGVLGFDYGYSLDAPSALVAWEAQFGDFANGAQVIIDQFLSSAEDKWARLSGLALLLPHGFEGQGPEHSSARFERFLNLSAEDNWQVVNLTTPAQYFHALRRQVVRPWRKPLVVMTPKSLLRHPRAVSSYDDLGGTFQRVLGDRGADPQKVRRVLLCSGKVYYALLQRRAERRADDTAIVRLEQLYPYPQAELSEELSRYPRVEKLVWVQEEPWNMGAWFFLEAHEHARRGVSPLPLSCVSRQQSASPATGHPKAHELEQERLLDEAFAEGDRTRPVGDGRAYPVVSA